MSFSKEGEIATRSGSCNIAFWKIQINSTLNEKKRMITYTNIRLIIKKKMHNMFTGSPALPREPSSPGRPWEKWNKVNKQRNKQVYNWSVEQRNKRRDEQTNVTNSIPGSRLNSASFCSKKGLSNERFLSLLMHIRTLNLNIDILLLSDIYVLILSFASCYTIHPSFIF